MLSFFLVANSYQNPAAASCPAAAATAAVGNLRKLALIFSLLCVYVDHVYIYLYLYSKVVIKILMASKI